MPTVENGSEVMGDNVRNKAACKGLCQAYDRSQEYLDVANVVLLVISTNRKVTLINKKGLEILGRQESDVVGKDWLEFIPERLRPQINDLFGKFFEGSDFERYCENPVLDSSGRERLIAWHNAVLRDEYGNVEATLSSGEDITEREQKEDALRNSEERFRKIFEEGPLGMATADSNFYFTGANDAFCRMMGYSEQQLKSRTFKDITHPEHLATDEESANKLLKGQIPIYRMEKRYRRKTGETLWASATISTLRNTKGEFICFFVMVEDITERKNAEAALKEINVELMRHSRLKNEFVSTVVHELRTPMCIFKNVISNALAGVSGPISQKLRKNLEMANQNIDRLSRIVNNFLDIAKIEAGRMQFVVTQVALQAVIREVAEAFAPVMTTKNISLNMVMPETDVIVEGDRDKLVQVLTNLVGNAAKFIPTGGHVLVTLSDCGDHVSISVHDDGSGIEPQYLDKIFDRFELGAASANTAQQSTGLGLSISKELVEMHGGQIWAESLFGHGSTFTFLLPKTQAKKS